MVTGSESKHASKCRRSSLRNLVNGGRCRVLHVDPVRASWWMRALPSQCEQTTLLFGCPTILSLQVVVAHDLRHERSVLVGQGLPEEVTTLVVFGDQAVQQPRWPGPLDLARPRAVSGP